ncbi:MAG: HAD family phosphatase [Planctomycetes bacterium]|nr:HAD family phosphatase [Planctomycetota bacterium]
MSYSAVIFDLDGVIVDTEPLSRDGWRYAFEEMGFAFGDEMFFRLVGLSSDKIADIFRQEYGSGFCYAEAERLRHEYIKGYVKENGIRIKPGVFELLDFLDERGIRRAIATSTSRKAAEHKLVLTKLRERFETMVCGDEVENGKPAPDIFLLAAEKLGAPAGECVVVEDSENGIRAGHAAGMDVVMVKDLIVPDEEVRGLTCGVFSSLHEVKSFLENGS